MAASITATVGGASSNSYVDVATAQAYLDERPNVEDWTGATADERIRALIAAARRLDQEQYRGRIASSAQALQWPRVGVEDRNGYTVASTTVPQEVKDAQVELALAMLGDDLLADSGLEAFESVKLGAMAVEPRQRDAGALPANVRREIEHYLTTPSTSQVRLIRG